MLEHPPADHSLRARRAGAPLVLAAALLAGTPAFAEPSPAVNPPDGVFWVWGRDGRFETSKKPCATESTRQGLLDFIGSGSYLSPTAGKIVGSEIYVNLTGGKISLTRGRTPGHHDQPVKHLRGKADVPMGTWYRGEQTWLVELSPRISPAFATVTLVVEANDRREGEPKCFERWIAPVSP